MSRPQSCLCRHFSCALLSPSLKNLLVRCDWKTLGCYRMHLVLRKKEFKSEINCSAIYNDNRYVQHTWCIAFFMHCQMNQTVVLPLALTSTTPSTCNYIIVCLKHKLNKSTMYWTARAVKPSES